MGASTLSRGEAHFSVRNVSLFYVCSSFGWGTVEPSFVFGKAKCKLGAQARLRRGCLHTKP